MFILKEEETNWIRYFEVQKIAGELVCRRSYCLHRYNDLKHPKTAGKIERFCAGIDYKLLRTTGITKHREKTQAVVGFYNSDSNCYDYDHYVWIDSTW